MADPSPLLLLHILTATVGLLSGYLSIVVGKGSGLHRVAGSVFFVAMVAMSSSAAYIATFDTHNRLNIVVSPFTLYLVVTAWWTAKRRNGGRSLFDYGALLFVIGIAAVALTFAFQATAKGRPIFLFVAFVALLAIRSDIRMLRRGGVTGPPRITRHLLRMGFALLIATYSLYPGQAELFPESLRKSGLLAIPHLFLIGSMLVGVLRMKRKTPAVPPASRDGKLVELIGVEPTAS